MSEYFPTPVEAQARFSILPISEEAKVPPSYYEKAFQIFGELRAANVSRAYELLESIGSIPELKAVLICLDYDLVANVRSRGDLLDRVRGTGSYRGRYKDYLRLLGELLKAAGETGASDNCPRELLEKRYGKQKDD